MTSFQAARLLAFPGWRSEEIAHLKNAAASGEELEEAASSGRVSPAAAFPQAMAAAGGRELAATREPRWGHLRDSVPGKGAPLLMSLLMLAPGTCWAGFGTQGSSQFFLLSQQCLHLI